MDAKTLLEILHPDNSTAHWTISDKEIKNTILSALELAASLQGGPDETPETNAMIQPCDGTDCVTGEPIPVVFAGDCERMERQRNAALIALRDEREQAGVLTKLCQLLGDNPNDYGPSCDYKCKTCNCGLRAWQDEIDVLRAALAAQEGSR